MPIKTLKIVKKGVSSRVSYGLNPKNSIFGVMKTAKNEGFENIPD